jgi:hypothetical protein
MENSGVLKHRWSLTIKAQIVSATFVLLAMTVVPILGELFLDPDGHLYNALYWYGLWLKSRRGQ